MDTALFQNILFLSLSLFILLVTVVFVVVAVYVVLAVKNLNRLLKVVKEESEKIVNDIESMRSSAKSNGVKFASMMLSLVSFLKQNKKSKKD